MKKLITPKTDAELLKTHPITSKIKGWFIKVAETSNNAFIVEAIDRYGRSVSKRGNDPIILQREIENDLYNFPSLR
ncbi:MAG: hypothetical protein LC778_16195 [Acidobacteria bacterium]|nr:hypothetical protein [Acidobacteriota bacterium]